MSKLQLSAVSNGGIVNVYTQQKSHFYAFLIVVMSSMFLFYKYVVQVSFSVMTQPLMRVYHLTGAGLGALAAFYFVTYLVTQLLAGPLADRFPMRYLGCLSMLMMTIGVLGFSHSHALWQAYVFRGCQGAGAAFATVGYLKLASDWFDVKQYSVVAGLLATAASLGAIIGGTPLADSVIHHGWKLTLDYCAGLGAFFSTLYFVVVRDAPKRNEMDNKGSFLANFRHCLSRRSMWLLMLYSGLAWSPLAVFGGLWGVPFLQQAYQLSLTSAATMVTAAFVGLAIGGPYWGWLAKVTDSQVECMIYGLVLAFMGLLTVLFGLTSSRCFLLLSMFGFGFGTGAFMLGFAYARSFFPLACAATVVALVNTGDAVLGALTEPSVGKFLDCFSSGVKTNGVSVFSLSDYHVALCLLPVELVMAMVVLFYLKKSSD